MTRREFRLATSVGGTLTGRGGDILIIDDPLKADAYSQSKRSAANDWFTNTLSSRLDDKRAGAIALVMQRVPLADLATPSLPSTSGNAAARGRYVRRDRRYSAADRIYLNVPSKSIAGLRRYPHLGSKIANWLNSYR